jgi:beta-glucosidase
MNLRRRTALTTLTQGLLVGTFSFGYGCTHPNIDALGASGSGNTPSSSGGAAGTASGGSGPAGGNAVMSCNDSVYSDKYTPGYNAAPDPMVQSLLSGMSLEQKVLQLQGVDGGTEQSKDYDDIERSQDDTALGIRGYMYRDAARGVNLDARQEGRPYMNNYSTVMPTASARGASFDLDLEYRIGEALGDETVASQNSMLLGPCMNILRHPYWGRAQETYGEDSYHLGRIASAFTAGLQTYVAGCAKHFAANNVENGREKANAIMDEQTLREIYGRHFEMVVQDGGIACIMASYNLINNVKSTQNAHLLTDILRNDFKFKGLVISDWWAMPSSQTFPTAQQAQGWAAEAIKAGLNIEVPWTLNYNMNAINAGLQAGDINQAQITELARQVLEQKFRFKSALLSQPIGLRPATTRMEAGSIVDNDAHIELAREAAERSMVLVKNAASTLPIKVDGSIKSIAVIGADVPYALQNTSPQPGTGTGSAGVIKFASDVPLGDRGSSRVNADPAKVIGPFAGIKAVADTKGITVTSGNSAAAAAGADLVVVMVGTTPADEGEEYALPSGGDRSSLTLPANQDALIDGAVAAAAGKPVVVVIETGGIINMPWLEKVSAVVWASYPGQHGGKALANLLFGTVNFGGKMPVAWPKESDLPPFKDSPTSTQMGYYLGYRYLDFKGITPIFPFGHGLSYTTFTYSNLKVPCADVSKGAVVEVSVDIKNNSAVKGDEIAMLFVSYPSTTAVRRSKKELKGFVRVAVEGNQTVTAKIPLRIADLKYWQGEANGSWVVESGPVNIMVGPDAGHLEQMGTLTVR